MRHDCTASSTTALFATASRRNEDDDGGLLLAAGLLTRVSTLFQLPILIRAVSPSYAQGLFTHDRDFQLQALVPFLLVSILFHGAGGRPSVDHVLRNR